MLPADQVVRRADQVLQYSSQPQERVPTEERPWGAFYVLDEGMGFKVKRITVHCQGRLSLQSHKRRAEHWTVVRGEATATVGDKVLTLRLGESVDIPCEMIHRLENFGTTQLEIIEVQFGDYLEEDDIVRYEDSYRPS